MIDLLFAAVVALNPAQSTVFEDDPSRSCVDMGNHMCGPNNSNGAAAGQYEGGVLIDPWPIG